MKKLYFLFFLILFFSFSTSQTKDGLEKSSKNKTFKLYPNPTSTGEVEISSTSTTAIEVSIFDVLGKKVKKEIVTKNRLDVSNLKSGIYLLRLTQDGSTSTKKLVIR